MLKKTPDSQIIIYRTKDGKDRIDVRLQDETVWLTQEHIAQLFQRTLKHYNLDMILAIGYRVHLLN